MGCRAGKGAGLVRIVSDRSRIIGDLLGMVGGRNTGIGIAGGCAKRRGDGEQPERNRNRGPSRRGSKAAHRRKAV
ncbi:hypothetical protein GCM10019060_04160 [Novosphingobium pokkalii]|nr:hypothetical protein GCM10019060_04160 [Novosphingobium pokkalii]